MQNTGLDESQAIGIKIEGRNISNIRYVDNTSIMAESKEELKIFLVRAKEESEKAGLKFNIQKTIQSLGQEDPLEVEMATHSGILSWKIPIERGAWWAAVHEVA